MHIDSEINKNQPLFHIQVHPLVVVLGSLFPSIHSRRRIKSEKKKLYCCYALMIYMSMQCTYSDAPLSSSFPLVIIWDCLQ